MEYHHNHQHNHHNNDTNVNQGIDDNNNNNNNNNNNTTSGMIPSNSTPATMIKNAKQQSSSMASASIEGSATSSTRRKATLVRFPHPAGSQYNSSNSTDCAERPGKKLRLLSRLSTYDEVVSTVISLNNDSAVPSFQQQNYAQAERYFLQAIHILDDHCLKVLTTSFPTATDIANDPASSVNISNKSSSSSSSSHKRRASTNNNVKAVVDHAIAPSVSRNSHDHNAGKALKHTGKAMDPSLLPSPSTATSASAAAAAAASTSAHIMNAATLLELLDGPQHPSLLFSSNPGRERSASSSAAGASSSSAVAAAATSSSTAFASSSSDVNSIDGCSNASHRQQRSSATLNAKAPIGSHSAAASSTSSVSARRQSPSQGMPRAHNGLPSPLTLSSLSSKSTAAPEAAKPAAKNITDSSSKSTYHYDEGMHMYSDAILLSPINFLGRSSDSSSGSNHTILQMMGCIKFALLYNLGQAFIHANEFDRAEHWLHQALIEYPASANDSTVSLIKLLHNLGYCAFRRNHNLVAMQSYENALNIAKSLAISDQRCHFMAASLNCVAVMKFVQHPQTQSTLEAAKMLERSHQLYKMLLLQQQQQQQFSLGSAAASPSLLQLATPQSIAQQSTTMATVLNNLGRVYYFNRNYQQALKAYTECLQLRQKFLSASSLDTAVTIYNMGQTYHQLDRPSEALECYKVFKSMILEKLPFESRDVAIVYKCMAELYHERHELKRCHECLEQSLRAARACLGSFHSEVASILNKIGNVCYELCMYDEAMRHYRQGLEIERIVLGPCHPHTVVTMVNIAHIHKQQKNYRQALLLYSRVRSIQASNARDEDELAEIQERQEELQQEQEQEQDECDGSDLHRQQRRRRRQRQRQQRKRRMNNIDEATSLSNMGLMQYNLKDYRGAFESYQEALRIRRDYYDTEDHPDIASTLNSIGLTLFKQKLYVLAQECFAQCLKIRKRLLGDSHRDVAVVWYNMGTIYFEQGEDDQAISCYQETLRVEELALDKHHSDVVMTLQHIGQVYQQIGKFEEALKYLVTAKCREVRRISLKSGSCGDEPPSSSSQSQSQSERDTLGLAKIWNLIGNLYLQQGCVPEMMEAFSEALRLIDSLRALADEASPDASSRTSNNDSRSNGINSLLIAGYNFYGLSKTNPPAAATA
eukprot:CAMPEP_0119547754 /NCGR_PEP_ID=MMETSP1352-20130426/1792_1 /TAXON_ID=265584 /ORGANISM="Stauroneis constricta, Strain CCMP1120" /LENGTH=1156 /DNA_ID=CAMNT_0007592773 /DNA_START=107 /DNA_END=3577 /DNA_ORIENTATION=-